MRISFSPARRRGLTSNSCSTNMFSVWARAARSGTPRRWCPGRGSRAGSGRAAGNPRRSRKAPAVLPFLLLDPLHLELVVPVVRILEPARPEKVGVDRRRAPPRPSMSVSSVALNCQEPPRSTAAATVSVSGRRAKAGREQSSFMWQAFLLRLLWRYTGWVRPQPSSVRITVHAPRPWRFRLRQTAFSSSHRAGDGNSYRRTARSPLAVRVRQRRRSASARKDRQRLSSSIASPWRAGSFRRSI